MIGEKLVRAGIITEEQRDAALEYQEKFKVPFSDALIRLGHISENRLLHILSLEFGTKFIPTTKLRDLDVSDTLVGLFPKTLAEHNTVFPVIADKEKGALHVVMGTTIEQEVLDMVSSLCGYKEVQAYVGLASTVNALIDKYYHDDATAFDQLEGEPKEEQQREASFPRAPRRGEAEEPLTRTTEVGMHSVSEDLTPVPLDAPRPILNAAPPATPAAAMAAMPQPPAPAAPVAPATPVAPAAYPQAPPKAAAPAPPVAPAVAPAPAAPASPRAKGPAPASGDTSRIDKILTHLVKLGASDLHLSALLPPKMRLDGDIAALPGYENALSSDQIDALMRPAAPPHIQEQYDASGDADFAHQVDGVARFRMNWFRTIRGEGAVMRTIPSKIPTLEDLKFPPIIKSLCDLTKGLVVVTGPTGSGKSTTLAAMVDYINMNKKYHIITIEDPVEFVHGTGTCLMNQREVHSHTESFSRALRAALREDPDIVLVGEMRDLETVHIAIETAETGHLVFGTLHTTTAASTVDRIIDQFPSDQQAQIRVMLSESLRGVISQTLCKKVGGGRTACMEILVVNNAISNLIREGKTYQVTSIMQTSKGSGMQTQINAMMELVKKGVVTPEEAVLKSVDQTLMLQALESAGIKAQGWGDVLNVTR